jgi:hypothetical protein
MSLFGKMLRSLKATPVQMPRPGMIPCPPDFEIDGGGVTCSLTCSFDMEVDAHLEAHQAKEDFMVDLDKINYHARMDGDLTSEDDEDEDSDRDEPLRVSEEWEMKMDELEGRPVRGTVINVWPMPREVIDLTQDEVIDLTIDDEMDEWDALLA